MDFEFLLLFKPLTRVKLIPTFSLVVGRLSDSSELRKFEAQSTLIELKLTKSLHKFCGYSINDAKRSLFVTL